MNPISRKLPNITVPLGHINLLLHLQKISTLTIKSNLSYNYPFRLVRFEKSPIEEVGYRHDENIVGKMEKLEDMSGLYSVLILGIGITNFISKPSLLYLQKLKVPSLLYLQKLKVPEKGSSKKQNSKITLSILEFIDRAYPKKQKTKITLAINFNRSEYCYEWWIMSEKISEEMGSLIHQLEDRLNLPDSDTEEVVIESSIILPIASIDWSLTMLSWICIPRVVLKWEFINEVRHNWNLTKTPIISPFKHKTLQNVFILEFRSESDYHKVKECKPWFFNGDLVVIKNIPQSGIPKEVDMSHELFWLKAVDVPVQFISKEGLTKVVKPAGVYQKHDNPFDGNMLERNVMVQVLVDLKKKVKYQMVAVTEDGQRNEIKWEFDRLPKMCNKCNIIAHPWVQCEGSNKWKSTNYQAGGSTGNNNIMIQAKKVRNANQIVKDTLMIDRGTEDSQMHISLQQNDEEMERGKKGKEAQKELEIPIVVKGAEIATSKETFKVQFQENIGASKVSHVGVSAKGAAFLTENGTQNKATASSSELLNENSMSNKEEKIKAPVRKKLETKRKYTPRKASQGSTKAKSVGKSAANVAGKKATVGSLAKRKLDPDEAQEDNKVKMLNQNNKTMMWGDQLAKIGNIGFNMGDHSEQLQKSLIKTSKPEKANPDTTFSDESAISSLDGDTIWNQNKGVDKTAQGLSSSTQTHHNVLPIHGQQGLTEVQGASTSKELKANI